MSDNKLPELIKNRLDLKMITLTSVMDTIDILKSGKIDGISISPKTSIMIFTNFGMVEGENVCFSDSEDSKPLSTSEIVKKLIETCFIIRNNEIAKLEEENKDLKLINDSSAVILENVTITPYANPMNKLRMQHLILFTDQIAGISFGEFQKIDFVNQ